MRGLEHGRILVGCLLLAGLAASGGGIVLRGRSDVPEATIAARERNRNAAKSAAVARAAFAGHQNTAADAGWPNLFGPSHDCVSGERGVSARWPSPAGPRVLWRREIGAGYSAPVARGDRLVVFYRLGDEEVLASLDAKTGEPGWDFRSPTHYTCRYEYSSGPYSTPVIDDDRVYAVSAEGVMRCVRADDGALVWERRLCDEYGLEPGAFPVGATPLVEDGRLIFNLGAAARDAGIIALDKRTGATLWTATDHGAGFATPIAATIHSRRMVFVVTFEGLVALDPREGRVFWTVAHRPKAPDSFNATSPVVDGDLVLMVTGPGPGSVCLRVLADGSCREVWRDRRVLDSQFNPLVCLGGRVYGYTSSRQGGALFRCVEMATGRMCWEWRSDLGRGTSLAVDGQLILLGERGRLAALSADPLQPRELAPLTAALLSAPCYSAPALNRGLLYLRNEATLLCLDLRDAPDG